MTLVYDAPRIGMFPVVYPTRFPLGIDIRFVSMPEDIGVFKWLVKWLVKWFTRVFRHERNSKSLEFHLIGTRSRSLEIAHRISVLQEQQRY